MTNVILDADIPSTILDALEELCFNSETTCNVVNEIALAKLLSSPVIAEELEVKH